MVGWLLNAGTVAAGTTLGCVGGARLPERIREPIPAAAGLFTFALGISGALHVLGELTDALIVLIALMAGGMIGTALDIEGRLLRLGARLRRLARGVGGHRFAEGFLDASVIFCVGPLTILGSIQDGLSGDMRLIAIKSILDGFMAFGLASVYGIGVGASAATILVYQGALTLGASGLQGVFSPPLLNALDGVGGLIVLGIGFRLLAVRDVKVGNFLPALVLAPLGAWLLRL